MEKFGKFSLGTILFALAMFVQSIVQMFMWNWFVVPLGFPTISFWLAMGISLTISAFCGSKSKAKSEDLIKGLATRGLFLCHRQIYGSSASCHQVKCPDRHATDFNFAPEIELKYEKIVSILRMFIGKD